MTVGAEIRDPSQVGPRAVLGKCVEGSAEEGAAGVIVYEDGQRWACDQVWHDPEHGDGGSGCWRLVPPGDR